MNIFKKWLKNDWKNAEILRIETFSEHCNILILNASHDTSSNYLKEILIETKGIELIIFIQL